jgi:hypothetical protein
MMKIKVSYGEVTVKGCSPAESDTNQMQACWRPLYHEIVIRTDLPPAQQAACLIHEMLHAIFSLHGLNNENLTEEEVCGILDGPLTAVLTDNPWLAGVLYQAVVHGAPVVKG